MGGGGSAKRNTRLVIARHFVYMGVLRLSESRCLFAARAGPEGNGDIMILRCVERA